MQTFLPYESYLECAQVLDNARLGKQRVECLQIMKAIAGCYDSTGAWKNHPAVKMWRDYPLSLLTYSRIICIEWRRRGFKDTCENKMLDIYNRYLEDKQGFYVFPPFLGDERLHLSHRSNLLRKDEKHYRQYFGEDCPNNLNYYWPVS